MRILLILLVLPLAAAAQRSPTADSLRTKYRTTDIFKETEKRMQTDSAVYPDSLVLPPWHYTDTWVGLPDTIRNFRSISFDIRVKDPVPKGYKLYIAPFSGVLGGMPFYCGLQTASGGKKRGGKDQEIGRGGIFSRWYERSDKALKTPGYFASSGDEGDFISVRNRLEWDKGTYRVLLYKSGYVPGKPVLGDTDKNSLIFSFGQYEQSWVTMKVTCLETGLTVTIGSLAFPGRTLVFSPVFCIFFEQYGEVIDFSRQKRDGMWDYRSLPIIGVDLSGLRINGTRVNPSILEPSYNAAHNPEQDKIHMPMPRVADVQWEKETGTIHCTTGKLFEWKAE